MSQDHSPPRQAACPQCGHPALLSPDNPFRPFCSERCKLLDFGAWVEQRYSIAPTQAEDEDGATPLQ